MKQWRRSLHAHWQGGLLHCPQACTRAHVCPTCASHPPVLLPPLQYETKGTITSEESDKRESCLQSYPVALSCPALIHQLTCCIISARKKCSCESNCCAAEHTPPSSLLVHPVRLPCSGGPEHTLCLRLRQHLRLGEQPPPSAPGATTGNRNPPSPNRMPRKPRPRPAAPAFAHNPQPSVHATPTIIRRTVIPPLHQSSPARERAALTPTFQANT